MDEKIYSMKTEFRKADHVLPLSDPLILMIEQQTGWKLPKNSLWLARNGKKWTIICYKRKISPKGNVTRTLYEETLFNVSFKGLKFNLEPLTLTEKILSHPERIADWHMVGVKRKLLLATLECVTGDRIQNFVLKYDTKHIVHPHSTGKKSIIISYLMEKYLYGIPYKEVYFSTGVSDDICRCYAREHKIFVSEPKESYKDFIESEGFLPTYACLNTVKCCNARKWYKRLGNFFNGESMTVLTGLNKPFAGLDLPNDSHVCDIMSHWSELDMWLFIMRKGLDIPRTYEMGYNKTTECVYCARGTKYTFCLNKYWSSFFGGETLNQREWNDILAEGFKRERGWVKYNCTIEEFVRVKYRTCKITFDREEEKDFYREDVIDEYKRTLPDDNHEAFLSNRYCTFCGKRINTNQKIVNKYMNPKLEICGSCYLRYHNTTVRERVLLTKKFLGKGV